MDWTIYVYIARQAKKVAEPSLDGGEKIELKYLSFEEFVDAVTQPQFDAPELQLLVMNDKKREDLRSKLGLK
jgi:hypothetical protein